jgi:hypothetical protein
MKEPFHVFIVLGAVLAGSVPLVLLFRNLRMDSAKLWNRRGKLEQIRLFFNIPEEEFWRWWKARIIDVSKKVQDREVGLYFETLLHRQWTWRLGRFVSKLDCPQVFVLYCSRKKDEKILFPGDLYSCRRRMVKVMRTKGFTLRKGNELSRLLCRIGICPTLRTGESAFDQQGHYFRGAHPLRERLFSTSSLAGSIENLFSLGACEVASDGEMVAALWDHDDIDIFRYFDPHELDALVTTLRQLAASLDILWKN